MKKISYEEDDANHPFFTHTTFGYLASIYSRKYARVRSGYICLETLPNYCILT